MRASHKEIEARRQEPEEKENLNKKTEAKSSSYEKTETLVSLSFSSDLWILTPDFLFCLLSYHVNYLYAPT
jgi:hypothetical protein